MFFFFFSSRRRHTRFSRDWSSDVCSSDLPRRGGSQRDRSCPHANRVPPVKIAVPKETAEGEHRVALVPETVSRLTEEGLEVLVEEGAGEAASFPDSAYAEAGAQIAPRSEAFSAEVIVKAQKPSEEEIALLREGTVLIGLLQPLTDPEGLEQRSERGVAGFALESVPRITRAQAMDALSSQSTVSGYKAVVLAADSLPKLFPMLMTAVGT